MRRNLFVLGLLISLSSYAQNQVINGTLTTKGEISVGEDVLGKWGEGIKFNFRGTDVSNDYVWMAKYTPSLEITDLRLNIGDSFDDTDRFVVGTTHYDTKEFREWFVVRSDGNVGIGIAQPTSKLDVNGTVRAKEVKIEATGWADFVFSKEYSLPSLLEVKNHIEVYNRLPDIPSEAEVKENGVDLGSMQVKLLQKIEELTLYVIELKEENIEIKQELNNLKYK